MIEERTQYRVRCDRVKCRAIANEIWHEDKVEVIASAIRFGFTVSMAGCALCPACQQKEGGKP